MTSLLVLMFVKSFFNEASIRNSMLFAPTQYLTTLFNF